MSRLEEIKDHWKYETDEVFGAIRPKDIDWLISRVEELEEEKYQDPRQGMLEDLHMENERLKERFKQLEEEITTHDPKGRNYTNKQYVDLLHENQRYKQALEEILEARNKFYLQDYVDGVEEIARQALEVGK